MGFRKSLLQRLLTTSSATAAARSTSLSIFRNLLPSKSKSDKSGLFRRFLNKNGAILFNSSNGITGMAMRMPLGVREKVTDTLRCIDRERNLEVDRIRPPMSTMISMEEIRKVLKVSQMEKVKNRLRAISDASITYSEFLEICRGDADGDKTSLKLGHAIAKDLDKSGVVLILGDAVFLKPDQVARAVERAISFPKNCSVDSEMELEDLERKISAIDAIAINSVRRELWCGLGFMVIQTIGLMRLTFWDLSWDVMEPICFYITSIYFILGYAFFLRTSKDPSYEGVLQSRLAAKRKRLMDKYSFDAQRWLELRRNLGMDSSCSGRYDRINEENPNYFTTPQSSSSSSSSSSHSCQCRSSIL